jgi:serine/threonine-protein kinase HipA
MMSGNEHSLDVYLGKNKITSLHLKEDQLYWRYSQAWQQSGYPISPHLPFQSDTPTLNVQRFLRNLFPEGAVLDELLNNFHLSKNNTFGLVRALGLDLPGALIIIPSENELPGRTSFRIIQDDELIQRLNQREVNSLIIWDGKPRLSVAGIQEKINIVLKNKQFGFGEGALCSTHILKFEKKTLSHLVLNEYTTMKLASYCGLSVPNISLQQFGQHRSLLIERFDRKLVASDKVKRRHMIDGCQALNLPPDYKYEQNFGNSKDVAHIRDGASLDKLFDFTIQCANPARAKQQMLDWVLFNILIYNFDAHGKNISFFVGHDGLTITPFYDLVNIKLYPQFDQSMAMALGDEFDGENVHAYELADFADHCGLNRQFVANRLKRLIHKMMTSIDDVISSIELSETEEHFLEQYQRCVSENCTHLQEQSDLIVDVVI